MRAFGSKKRCKGSSRKPIIESPGKYRLRKRVVTECLTEIRRAQGMLGGIMAPRVTAGSEQASSRPYRTSFQPWTVS